MSTFEVNDSFNGDRKTQAALFVVL